MWFLNQLAQSKVPVEQTFHFSQTHQQEVHEKHFQPLLQEGSHWGFQQSQVAQDHFDMVPQMKLNLEMEAGLHVERPLKAEVVKMVEATLEEED